MAKPQIASLQQFGDEAFFVFCDHASNFIPAELNGLGIPDDLLATHIAWDIGAGALAIQLARLLNGRSFSCGFSRLIVDPNRALEAKDVIPGTSDLIPIPGNQMIGLDACKQRIDDYHLPYHRMLDEALDEAVADNPSVFVISVHSFTNRLMGAVEDRPWKVGLLWREDAPSAHAMMDYLRRETGWEIGDNEPYDARVFNYSIDRHVGPRGLRHLTIEVRQDVIEREHDIVALAEILATGVRTTEAMTAGEPAL